ncbi:hypothetical protein BR93DRAFT_561353 [Coniochaeta sp. PMI_546]|nr:hypothetical protein BR93DRAFT_561353 [Coniochaeta sp. PMI_546]
MATPEQPAYRSAAEHCFCEEQSDAIVQATAYHRKDYCRSVIWFSPREHSGIRQYTATPFRRTPASGLGSLDRLPVELMHHMLLGLDMYSLFNFRQVNIRARQMSDSLKQYRMLVTHALNTFCASLRTRFAIGVSLSDFYPALCTKACTLCGDFGRIHVPANVDSMLFQMPPGGPRNASATSCCCPEATPPDQGRSRPTKVIQDFAWDIFDGGTRTKSRITAVSVHQAMHVFRQRPQAPPQAQPANSTKYQKFNFMGSCALPYYDMRTGRVEHGVSCARCQLALEMDVIGSRGVKRAFETRDKVYAEDGFLEHFRCCEQAQLLWKSSAEGISPPAQLPEAARRGGYFNMRE